ncbi:hypothetical protein A2V68_02755 [candidate division Kazan bacterium RBG_13_50_9]|uniref:Oxidized purine nucleoside triphosphate hydrolase n=1 Tax=candidate division Kazan bacterium RBG_13_50_9 TaxID=1798535 RepID=A0A1F4NT75_UNCK3|nr:MAG: hypothetical protein A2V68_02755 [candidate division Kazan bacterium RBG_13_50_9]
MRNVTLCFLVRENEICLAMKKRRFGAGKWNGVGGKVEEGEFIKEAAVRELREEIGVDASVDDLDNVGNLHFYFNEHPDWNQYMHIFFIKRWTGEPKESEEMAPRWHKQNALPYNDMGVDDIHWLPQVLAGKRVEGEFYFDGDGEKLDKFQVRELATS